jgi:hypothetical protein
MLKGEGRKSVNRGDIEKDFCPNYVQEIDLRSQWEEWRLREKGSPKSFGHLGGSPQRHMAEKRGFQFKSLQGGLNFFLNFMNVTKIYNQKT